MNISKYQYCNDCYKTFTLSKNVINYLTKHPYAKVYCPRCDSNNIAQISKKQHQIVTISEKVLTKAVPAEKETIVAVEKDQQSKLSDHGKKQ